MAAPLAPLLLLSCGVAWEPIAARASPRAVILHDHHAERIAYGRALGWQRALHAERAAQLRRGKDPPLAEPPLDDALILLQHPPTYTLGALSDVANVLGGFPDFELVRTERGGEVSGPSASAILHAAPALPAAALPSEALSDGLYGSEYSTGGTCPAATDVPPTSFPHPLRPSGDVPRSWPARHLPTARPPAL
jgi:hypothetical protein